MDSSKPSLRSLARALGLSHTTVSDALRGTGRVDSRTVERVRKAAHEMGYQHNPLASNLMSEMRRSRGSKFRGLIAVVSRHEPEQPPQGLSFPRELLVGASIRAQELGFGLEEFIVDRAGLTMPRLNSVLQARGIHGIVILPQWTTPDWSKLEWQNYAGIYAGPQYRAAGLALCLLRSLPLDDNRAQSPCFDGVQAAGAVPAGGSRMSAS